MKYDLRITGDSNRDGWEFMAVLSGIGREIGNGTTIGNTVVRWRPNGSNIADIHGMNGEKVGTLTVQGACPAAMKTSINGEEAPWTDAIQAKWDEAMMNATGDHLDFAVATSANYFTPRPWRNEYDRGSREEGFTYVVKRSVWQVIIRTNEEVTQEYDGVNREVAFKSQAINIHEEVQT